MLTAELALLLLWFQPLPVGVGKHRAGGLQQGRVRAQQGPGLSGECTCVTRSRISSNPVTSLSGSAWLHFMMQAESSSQKNSLFSAMRRFIGAVNNMDHTVLVPSLLRDVPLDLPQDGDMYSSYVLLKSIRNDIEWGVLQGDERRKDPAEDDLEKEFHFHLNGLHAVLSKLTCRADTLTSRYKEEVGCRK